MHSRLRNIALGTLLLVLPVSGIRAICIASPTEGREGQHLETVVAETTRESRPLTECERLCPFHPPISAQSSDAQASSGSSDEESECALSDGAALTMLGNTAVLRPHTPLVVPHVVSAVAVDRVLFYSEPALAHFAPPPKYRAF